MKQNLCSIIKTKPKITRDKDRVLITATITTGIKIAAITIILMSKTIKIVETIPKIQIIVQFTAEEIWLTLTTAILITVTTAISTIRTQLI